MAQVQKYNRGDDIKRLEEKVSAYRSKLGTLNPQQQAEAQAYFNQLIDLAGQNNMTSGKKRTRRNTAAIYDRVLEMMDGQTDFTEGAAYQPSLRSDWNTATNNSKYLAYQQSRGVKGTSTSQQTAQPQSTPTKKHIFLDLLKGIDSGLSTFSFGDKMEMFKNKVSKNIDNFISNYGDGNSVYVNGIDRNDIQLLRDLKVYLDTFDKSKTEGEQINWGLDLIKKLYTVSPESLSTLKPVFPELFKEPTEAEKRRAQITGEDVNLPQYQNLLTDNNLHLIKDENGNIYAYDSDWNKYSGDGLDQISLSPDNYGQGIIIGSDGRVFYGNVGDIGENHWAKGLLEEARNRRPGWTNQYYIKDYDQDTDYIDSYLVNKFIENRRGQNPQQSKFQYADVSELFNSNTPIIAFDESGTPLSQGLFGELKLTPTTKFAWLNGNNELQIGDFTTASQQMGGFNNAGYHEGNANQTGNIVGLSNGIFSGAEGLSRDTRTKKFNFKRLIGTTIAGGVTGAISGMGIGSIPGFVIGALGTAGTDILGQYLGSETIGENPQRFVDSVIKALNDPNAKIDVPGAITPFTGSEFLNQFDSRKALIETVGILVNEGAATISPKDLQKLRIEYYRINKDNINTGVTLHNSGGILKAAYGSSVPQEVIEPDYHEENKSRAVKKEEEDSRKAQEQGYANSDVYRANKTTELNAVDGMRFLTMAQDVASIVASFVPGAGTGVAAGLGVTSMVTDMTADFLDPAVTTGEAIWNLGANAGFAALGLIPGAKMGKVARGIVKMAPKIMTGLAALNIAVDDSTQETLKKISKGTEKLNREDWRNLSHVLSLLAAGTRGVKGDIAKAKVKKQGSIIAKDNIGVKGLTDTEGRTRQYQKETVEEVNKALSKIKTSDEDADAKAIGILKEKLQITDEEAAAILISPKFQNIRGGIGKYSIATEASQDSRASYEALRQLWNKEAKEVKESSDLARRFARRFGGGEYTATQRAILELNPEIIKGPYASAYSPMVDWNSLRSGSDATRNIRPLPPVYDNISNASQEARVSHRAQLAEAAKAKRKSLQTKAGVFDAKDKLANEQRNIERLSGAIEGNETEIASKQSNIDNLNNELREAQKALQAETMRTGRNLSNQRAAEAKLKKAKTAENKAIKDLRTKVSAMPKQKENGQYIIAKKLSAEEKNAIKKANQAIIQRQQAEKNVTEVNQRIRDAQERIRSIREDKLPSAQKELSTAENNSLHGLRQLQRMEQNIPGLRQDIKNRVQRAASLYSIQDDGINLGKITRGVKVGKVNVKSNATIQSYEHIRNAANVKRSGFVDVDTTKLSTAFPNLTNLRGAAYNPTTNQLIVWKRGGVFNYET